MELIVYFDEDYPNSWIAKDGSKKIVSYFQEKGFLKCNADELAEWMRKTVTENKCNQSVVVFSQDVVPETVCHDSTSNALIRTYLDMGGTIFWIADVPFFYQGLNREHSSKVKKELFNNEDVESKIWTCQNIKPEFFEGKINAKEYIWMDENAKFARIWDRIATFRILGVTNVSVEYPASKTKITREGELLGINKTWYGIRPIQIKGHANKKELVPLTTCEPTLMLAKEKWVKDYEKGRRIPFPSFIDNMSKFAGSITGLVFLITSLLSIISGLTVLDALLALIGFSIFAFLLSIGFWLFYFRKSYANAWARNFNSENLEAGFFRIWDYKIDIVTDDMVNELYQLVLARIKGTHIFQ
jgi:hypothetical protein